MLLRSSSIAFGAAVFCCLALNANGQDEKRPATKRSTDAKVNVDGKKTREGASVNLMLHRATEINGMKVRNSANKELGTIKDIVIDVRPGFVKYAALSYGGFLGLGDKLFAVPWDAMQHHHDASSGDAYFVLDIDEATLKRSPGFDDSKWPDFANPQFEGKLDTFYEKFRKPHAGLTVTTPRVETKVDVKANNTTARDDKSAERLMLRASTIMGMKVRNEAQKELGKVNDLVIEVQPGKIRYAALSYGGFLGLGDKLFAVPWKAFEVRHDISQKETSLVLNVDEATLRKATGFDKNKWPNFADPSITNELDKYYGVTDRSATRTTEGAILRDGKDR